MSHPTNQNGRPPTTDQDDRTAAPEDCREAGVPDQADQTVVEVHRPQDHAGIQ